MLPLRLLLGGTQTLGKRRTLLACSLLTRCQSLLWSPYLHCDLTGYNTMKSVRWLIIFLGYIQPISATCKGASLRKQQTCGDGTPYQIRSHNNNNRTFTAREFSYVIYTSQITHMEIGCALGGHSEMQGCLFYSLLHSQKLNLYTMAVIRNNVSLLDDLIIVLFDDLIFVVYS